MRDISQVDGIFVHAAYYEMTTPPAAAMTEPGR